LRRGKEKLWLRVVVFVVSLLLMFALASVALWVFIDCCIGPWALKKIQ
jgi:hypothetical protein